MVIDHYNPTGTDINLSIGNCGWADTTKWFVHFDATNFTWDLIRHEIAVAGFSEVLIQTKTGYASV